MTKKIVSILLVAAVLCLSLVACGGGKATDGNATTESIDKHGVFGEFISETVDGKAASQLDLEGKKLTMVNIWATFCTPCIGEMPDLEKISKAYADKGLQVVGIPCDININSDGSYNSVLLAQAKKIITDTGVTYLNILPSPELNENKLSTVFSVPETVFLDENGNQVGESYIGSRSYEQWCDIIDSLLEPAE